MANTINFIQTNTADELISKVLTGKTLNFTRMAVGDGFSYDTNVAKGFKTLVNEVLSLDITKKETLSPSSVKITSAFKNTDAQQEFYYREVGLFAEDPDTGEEVLYAYGNRNDAAELITPAGSNIVTKQLIFVISVGDSANVTFNVNADVYALQEDMLDVQADIEQIQTDLGQAQTNITTLQSSKANRNLNNTGMITNCLLEVPQRVKYELTTAGDLTIKAGSVIIVPYGTNAPTYAIGDTFWAGKFKIIDIQYNEDSENPRLFYWMEVLEDITEARTGAETNGSLLINISGKSYLPYQELHSGDTAPTITNAWAIWYDTANNYIKFTSDTGATWTMIESSFPVLTYKANNSITYGSVTHVFNGMGYIGSTVWVDKGVKGLIPNGRNSDGSLNNIEYTVPNLTFKDCSGADYENICFYINTNGQFEHNFLTENETIYNDVSHKTYIPSKNYIYRFNGVIERELFVATGTIRYRKVHSLTPFTTFKAVNKSSDKSWLSSLAMPSGKYEDLELNPTGSTYKAPANGWYAIRKNVGIATAGVSFAVYDITGTTEIYRITEKNSVAEDEVALIIPILKRQVLQISYDATGETKYFRFIYAEGEVN